MVAVFGCFAAQLLLALGAIPLCRTRTSRSIFRLSVSYFSTVPTSGLSHISTIPVNYGKQTPNPS